MLLAFGIAGIATVFSPVFFGKEFTDCGILIRAITPIIVFKAWANVIRTQYLLPNEKDKDFIMSLFAGAIVNLIINSLLIPKLGAWGQFWNSCSGGNSLYLSNGCSKKGIKF